MKLKMYKKPTLVLTYLCFRDILTASGDETENLGEWDSQNIDAENERI